MQTIEAFEKEIKMQIDFLKNFTAQKLLSDMQQRRSFFCGTGDSFVSAQIAEVFSDFRARSFDPLDILKNKKLLKGVNLYLISISGNTISNIKLAKIAKNATAITANPHNKLAKVCKKSIILKYPHSGILTSGTISFLSSALTCISLVSRFQITDFKKIFRSAQMATKKIQLEGKIYILGNLYTMPIAMFCAAKFYEVLGLDAHYEKIEQFSHTSLFSAVKGDTVIIFEEKNPHNYKLQSHLKKCGLNVVQIQPDTKNLQEYVLFFVFVSEFIALYHAKKRKLGDCYFVQAKNLRKASSSMIY